MTMREICSKVAMKTPERRQSGVLTVNFDQVSHDGILLTLCLTLNRFLTLLWCFHCWLLTRKNVGRGWHESFLFHFLLTSKDVSKDCLRIPFSAEGFKMETLRNTKGYKHNLRRIALSFEYVWVSWFGVT